MTNTPSKPGPKRRELKDLEQLPNIGPALAAKLRLLGIAQPADLCGRDPYVMYEELNQLTGRRVDPCVLDVFLAVVRFMDGQPAKPWWKFTPQRKRELTLRQG
ncbi:MAG: mitomycin resistance protein [Planctomycetes bacterium]|nr:mitomycin resistance protein [Planctomycetota bacterium]